METVLVTGGAGYIGSHVVKLLGKEGYNIVVVDNLSGGHRESVLYGDFEKGDITDRDFMTDVVNRYRPDAVMHFAAFIEVGESVREPLKYYRNNTAGAINFLEVLCGAGVDCFIFSSTAAVYGIPEKAPIPESAPIAPINPYGGSKACVERVLRDLSDSGGMRYVSLRYFNACGADPEGEIGERHDPETHLIPLVLQAASGRREHISIFGTDYPTPDGTCLRDYIHVNDLAKAHVLALRHLLDGGGSRMFNLGYGHGFSVREVIDAAARVTGIDIPVVESDRREGDPPELVADSSLVRMELGWEPEHDDLDFIVRTAWDWEKGLSGP